MAPRDRRQQRIRTLTQAERYTDRASLEREDLMKLVAQWRMQWPSRFELVFNDFKPAIEIVVP